MPDPSALPQRHADGGRHPRLSLLQQKQGVASLIETCKLNLVNPQSHLTDVLTRLVDLWSQSRIDELMPWHWATQQVH
jgi:hypothetical protein